MKAEILDFPERTPDIQLVVLDSKETLFLFMEVFERTKARKRMFKTIGTVAIAILCVATFYSIVLLIAFYQRGL